MLQEGSEDCERKLCKANTQRVYFSPIELVIRIVSLGPRVAIALPSFPSSSERVLFLSSPVASLCICIGTLWKERQGCRQPFPVVVQNLVENLGRICDGTETPTSLFRKQDAAVGIARNLTGLQQKVIDPEIEPVFRFDGRASIA